MKRLTALLLALCLTLSMSGVAFADYVQARLNQRISTRSGPGTDYTEPGTFLSAGDYVTVHSKKWDWMNEIWWVQVEFTSGGKRYRAYTGSWRMDVDLSRVPEELSLRTCEVQYDTRAYAGPGSQYASMGTVRSGMVGTLYEVENGYAQIEIWDQYTELMMRVWVDISDTTARKDYHDVDTFPQYGSPCYEGWYTSLDEIYERNGYNSYYDNDYYDDDYYYDDDDYYYGSDPVGQTIRITVSSGNARSGPGAEYSQVAYVEYGDYYVVYDTDVASNGVTWFQIYVDGCYAWISSGLTNVGKY